VTTFQLWHYVATVLDLRQGLIDGWTYVNVEIRLDLRVLWEALLATSCALRAPDALFRYVLQTHIRLVGLERTLVM
jgi:hypothetical protein